MDRAAASSRGGREAAGVVYDPARSLFVGNLHVDIEVSRAGGAQLEVWREMRDVRRAKMEVFEVEGEGAWSGHSGQHLFGQPAFSVASKLRWRECLGQGGCQGVR